MDKPDKKNQLTPKQEKFCLGYLETGNAYIAMSKSEITRSKTVGGFYVYLLIDPTNGEIFYVGKGKGKRMYSHELDAKAGRIANVKKHQRIVSVLDKGHQVDKIVFHSCSSEAEAFDIERIMIARLHEGLTNIIGGVTSQIEIAMERAKHALSRLISYEQWVSQASQAQLQAASNIAGSPLACYQDHKDTLERYASGDFSR